MKKHQFEVVYLNGNEELFYCNDFTKAVIMAMCYAISNGWDMRIKYIVDEQGVQIQDIQPPTFSYSK